MKIEKVKQLFTHLEGQRTKRLAQQREIGEYILPSRGLFNGEDKEGLRNKRLFNNAAQRALRKAAAGMTQAITPSSEAWFRHAFMHRADREVTGANEYVDAVDAMIRRFLSAGGFYQAIHTFNKELLGFGCALLGCEGSARTLVRCFCQTCGTYSVALDEERNLTGVARRLSMTAESLADRFGKDKLSESVISKLDEEPYASVDVCHVVIKRAERDDAKRDRRNMPYASYWYEANGTEFLEVSGFMEMPFFFTTWEDARGIYGTGPGDEALSDQKGIESWELRKSMGIEKMIDPPLYAPGMLKRHISTGPGAINSASSFSSGESLKPVYEVNFGTAVQHVQEEVNQIAMRLDDVMMANIFANMSLETRPAGMTMTEYMDRRRRSAELMGPTVSSYEPRILTPLIERVFGILDRAGVLPIPPEGLSPWATLDVSYQSPMAQMLEQAGAVAIQQFIEIAMPIIQNSPEASDKLIWDQMLDELSQRIGVPASVIRSDEQVAAIRQQRAEAQAAQQQAAMEAQMMDQMAKVGNVRTEGTVAGALLGAEEGQTQ